MNYCIQGKYQRANQSFISMKMNYAAGWRPKDCLPSNLSKVIQGTIQRAMFDRFSFSIGNSASFPFHFLILV